MCVIFSHVFTPQPKADEGVLLSLSKKFVRPDGRVGGGRAGGVEISFPGYISATIPIRTFIFHTYIVYVM